jgi:thiol-disulfide isomerase/thioredoxin
MRLFPRLPRQALLATALLTGAPALAAVPAPHLDIATFNQLAQPLPLPYNTTADADRAVAEARQRAIARHKLLLIDLGGNWCLDCRLLAGTIENPRLKSFVEDHYELVTVDIGRFDKNLQIPAHYGITHRLEGVPSLLVVEPRANRLINEGHTAALADARSMSPQSLADWLASWL